MGLRGPKPKGKVKIKWSHDFAYAIGLLATDGCLLNDGRHIDLTSNDYEQLLNFNRALSIEVFFGKKNPGLNREGKRVQFSDVLFYKFLLKIGLTPHKSKTLGKVYIPKKYFFDFFRGCFDGDGSFYSYWDPRWKSSFMFYIALASSSPVFLAWIQDEIFARLKIRGHISDSKKRGCGQLRYAKKESLKILKSMYYSDSVICLSRKRKKSEKALKITGVDK